MWELWQVVLSYLSINTLDTGLVSYNSEFVSVWFPPTNFAKIFLRRYVAVSAFQVKNAEKSVLLSAPFSLCVHIVLPIIYKNQFYTNILEFFSKRNHKKVLIFLLPVAELSGLNFYLLLCFYQAFFFFFDSALPEWIPKRCVCRVWLIEGLTVWWWRAHFRFVLSREKKWVKQAITKQQQQQRRDPVMVDRILTG